MLTPMINLDAGQEAKSLQKISGFLLINVPKCKISIRNTTIHFPAGKLSEFNTFSNKFRDSPTKEIPTTTTLDNLIATYKFFDFMLICVPEEENFLKILKYHPLDTVEPK